MFHALRVGGAPAVGNWKAKPLAGFAQ